MIEVKLLVFGGAREVVGAAEFPFELAEGCTAREALDDICLHFDGLMAYRSSIRMAVNGQYAADDQRIQAGDELALIPPVAGG